jgi:hypothetical protein
MEAPRNLAVSPLHRASMFSPVVGRVTNAQDLNLVCTEAAAVLGFSPPSGSN